ncbi:MAG: MazG nucleotide pyrophosphohydrolase domain-containing protein [bacterium]
MNINEKVKKFLTKNNQVPLSIMSSMLDLQSEVGELSKEILRNTDYGFSNNQEINIPKDEIGDCFYSLIMLSISLDIDIEEALDIALKKYEGNMSSKRGGF